MGKNLVGAHDCGPLLAQTGEGRRKAESAWPIGASHVSEKGVYLLLFHRMDSIR